MPRSLARVAACRSAVESQWSLSEESDLPPAQESYPQKVAPPPISRKTEIASANTPAERRGNPDPQRPGTLVALRHSGAAHKLGPGLRRGRTYRWSHPRSCRGRHRRRRRFRRGPPAPDARANAAEIQAGVPPHLSPGLPRRWRHRALRSGGHRRSHGGSSYRRRRGVSLWHRRRLVNTRRPRLRQGQSVYLEQHPVRRSHVEHGSAPFDGVVHRDA